MLPGEQTVNKGPDAENRKGDADSTADMMREQRDTAEKAGAGKHEDDESGGVVRMRGAGGFDAIGDFPEVIHVSRSLGMVSLLMLLLGITVAVCGPGMALLAGGAFTFFPISLAVLYVVVRQRSNRPGPPLDMLPAGLALYGTALALLLSGNAFAGLLTAGMALGLCGAVAGTWLALLTVRTGMTLRQSLEAVFGLKGRHSGSLAR